MIDERRSFSDRLVECESPAPLGASYRKEIDAMFEKHLGPASRAIWIFWTVFGLVQAVGFGCVAVISYGRLPLWGTVGFTAAAAFGLAFGSIAGWIAWSGRIQLKTQPPAIVGLSWVFVVLNITLLMVFAPDSIVGVRMLVSGLVFLVFGAVFLLASRTEQAELRTKEKLLEIEYRLAELADRLPPAADG